MNNLETYAVICRDIKLLEEQRDALKEIVLQEMEESGETSITTDVGKISLSPFSTWEYPEEVKALEEDYKTAKKESQQFGTATEVKRNIIKFSINKE